MYHFPMCFWYPGIWLLLLLGSFLCAGSQSVAFCIFAKTLKIMKNAVFLWVLSVFTQCRSATFVVRLCFCVRARNLWLVALQQKHANLWKILFLCAGSQSLACWLSISTQRRSATFVVRPCFCVRARNLWLVAFLQKHTNHWKMQFLCAGSQSVACCSPQEYYKYW